MNKLRKIIVLISIIIVGFEIVFLSAYAWFYFPNAKGLELDSAPAVNVSMKLYRSNGTSFVEVSPQNYRLAKSKDFKNNDFIDGITYYELTETLADSYEANTAYYVKTLDSYTKVNISNEDDFDSYDALYTISNIEASTYSSSNTYYIATYAISEAYEFFQWGDEYICEDEDSTHYYALECICDSEACTDGYIKSILSANLDCLGAFTYNNGSNTANASIPVFEASYKYATRSNIDLTNANALVEAKAESSNVVNTRVSTYEKFINGKYYTLSGSNYVEATTYSNQTNYIMDIQEYFIPDSTSWNKYSSKDLYYYDDNGSYIPAPSYISTEDTYYELKNISEANNLKGFSTSANKTTLDGITTASLTIDNEIVMDRFYPVNGTGGLDSTQYVHDQDSNHSSSYIRFVIFIRIEPDEDYISSYMSRNNGYTEFADTSSILISNSLTFDMTLRTVPKYTSYGED